METRWRSAATVPLNQTRRRISFSVRHARAFGAVLSVFGPGMQDLLALMDAGLVGRSRRGPVEHSRNMGLVAGTGATAATRRGMYDVEVVELYSTEGAMDSLTKRDDSGAGRGELDFKVELPAVVPVLKEVYEDERGGIDPARA